MLNPGKRFLGNGRPWPKFPLNVVSKRLRFKTDRAGTRQHHFARTETNSGKPEFIIGTNSGLRMAVSY